MATGTRPTHDTATTTRGGKDAIKKHGTHPVPRKLEKTIHTKTRWEGRPREGEGCATQGRSQRKAWIQDWRMRTICATATLWGMQSAAWAADPEELFGLQCAGCHTGGGNIIEANKTLKLEDLQKYGLDSVQELYDLIYSGKGRMPGYGEGCQGKLQCTFGKRFTNQEVQEVAEYVLQKAQDGWK